MASNGLLKMAKTAKCRICQRVRKTEYLKTVGIISHGYATGYHWVCSNSIECKEIANKKLNNPNILERTKREILLGLKYY